MTTRKNSTPYWEKLKDPRWQKKRLEVLEIYKWRCRHCGTDSQCLHVHHNWYIKGREPWEYHPTQLSPLCEKCHSMAEGCMEEVKDLLSRVPPRDMAYIAAAALALTLWEKGDPGIKKFSPMHDDPRLYKIFSYVRRIAHPKKKK